LYWLEFSTNLSKPYALEHLINQGGSMFKKAFVLFVFAVGTTVFAGTELKINGEFKNLKGNLPAGWVQNKGSWTKPFGKVEIVKEGEKNFLKITSDKKITPVYTTKAYPAKAGDKVKLEIKAKGKGKASIGIYAYTAKGWAGSSYKYFTLSDKEAESKFVIEIKDGKRKDKVLKVTKIRIVVSATSNSTLTISEVEAEILDEKK
jgi:hypothetical protein